MSEHRLWNEVEPVRSESTGEKRPCSSEDSMAANDWRGWNDYVGHSRTTGVMDAGMKTARATAKARARDLLDGCLLVRLYMIVLKAVGKSRPIHG